MTRLLLAAVFAGVLSVAGAAHAQVATRPGQVVTELRAEDLDWLVAQGGHTVVARRPDMSADVDTQGGFKFMLQGEACEGAGKAMRCEGLALFAYWTLDASDAAKVAPLLVAFNRDYPAAKVFMWDGAAAIERYVVISGGVTVENLLTEIEVFLLISDAFWTEIDEATKD